MNADVISITFAQYEAIERLLASIRPSDRAATKNIVIDPDVLDSGKGDKSFCRVTLDAGWGTLAWDIDREGNSADVNFGASDISLEAEGLTI